MGGEGPSGVLLLDKPAGWSSTQALARCKRILAARKAGHTGTLDPFATGLLPLVFGEATKFSRFLIDSHKSYRATLRLGQQSTTGDPEGEITQSQPIEVNSAQIDEVLRGFEGAGEQIPPMHSAVRQGGRRLYELARAGIEVDRKPRPIEITRLARERFEADTLVLAVTCSKGTFIRTLAADIGRALGCGAYLVALQRTEAGPFRLREAHSIEALQELGAEAARRRLLPVEVLIAGLARFDAAHEAATRFTQGQEIGCEAASAGSEWAVHGPDGTFLGVGFSENAGRLAPLRLMATGKSQGP